MDQNSDRFQLGDYWLSQRRGSAQWCRTWYDAGTRQTQRASLGTSDIERAKVLLAGWYVSNATLKDQRPDDVPVAAVMARYLAQHGEAIPSRDMARLACRVWSEWWGTRTVADMRVAEIEDFATALRERYALGTVRRLLGVGKAALNRAHHRQEITAVPYIALPTANAIYEHVATVAQLRAMLNAIPSGSHLWPYCMIRLNTGCRGDAVLELTSAQVDRVSGTVRLNPAGRAQTKKRRPDVPLTATLRNALTAPPDPSMPFVNYDGRPVASIKTAWRDLQRRAGLPAWFLPKIMRHTVATELRRRGVPGWEVSALLGHSRGEASATTARYAKFAPGWMSASREALDAWMVDLGVPQMASTHLTRNNP